MKRTKRGFTLVEIATTMMIVVMSVGVVMGVTVQSARLGSNIKTGIANSNSNRLGLDLLNDDLKNGTEILSQYPANGPKYFTDQVSTVIISIPNYDVLNKKILTANTIVIYHLNNVTKRLERWIAGTVNNVQSQPKLDGYMVYNCDYFDLSYKGFDSFIGDGGTAEFFLDAKPSGPGTINISTVDWNNTEYAWFNTQSVAFERAPVWGVPIDVAYPVDPTVVATATGGVGANIVKYTLRGGFYSVNARNQKTLQQTTFSSQVKLLAQ